MKSLNDYTGTTLELIQPAFFKEGMELRSGETVLGRMTSKNFWSSTSEIEIHEKKWEIKKESIWKGILGIYKYGYEMPSFKYVPLKMTLAEVQFPKGEYLQVKQYFFKSAVELIDRNGEIIVRAKSKSGLKKKYFIELLRENILLNENPWLVFLMCYIIIRKEKKSHYA